MKYLTRKQMQELDWRTIENYGIPALVLMENAGRAVAREVINMLPHPKQSIVSIICGPGNNGGDGFVAARHLFNQGVKVKVFCLGNIKELLNKGGEVGVNLKSILRMKIPLREAKIITLKSAILNSQSALIVDAIFGIGLTRSIEGRLKDLISAINQLAKPTPVAPKASIIAVDVPSGLDCDKGVPLGIAIKATRTVTFGTPKIGFKKPAAKKYLGKLIVADISIPRFLL